jgi:hypothetical protein
MGHLIKNFFQLGSRGSQKNDVTGGSVHVSDTASAEIPQITYLSQVFGRVKFTTGLVYPHGVEMRHPRELLGLVTIPPDNTAAVTENTDDPAVLPMCPAMLEGKLQYP